jgi:hypothetical protein
LKIPRNATIGSVKRIFNAVDAMKYISLATSNLPFLARILSASGSPAAALAMTTEGCVSGNNAKTTAKAPPIITLNQHLLRDAVLDPIPPMVR